MTPTESQALTYIRKHLGLAAEFARLGKRGLHDYHAELADRATLGLIDYRNICAAMVPAK